MTTETFETTSKIKVAVVTGRHPYEVPQFQDALASMSEIACYPQDMQDWVDNCGGMRDRYDAVLFYNFHQGAAEGEPQPWEEPAKAALQQLGQSSQGIVVLHHAILAFLEWDFWADLVGVSDRSFDFFIGEALRTEIANPEHPITKGLTPWEMVDETYTMGGPGEDSEVLLTTEHPRSTKTLAWTRQFNSARVFCYQSGHGSETYGDANFRTVLSRGIQWAAGRL
jgi:hypothetical protein